jgi:hypothetical protein
MVVWPQRKKELDAHLTSFLRIKMFISPRLMKNLQNSEISRSEAKKRMTSLHLVCDFPFVNHDCTGSKMYRT